MEKMAPAPISGLRFTIDNCKLKVIWQGAQAKKELEQSAYYCIYRFGLDENIDLTNGAKIVKIVRDPYYIVSDPKEKVKYVITSLNRLHQESVASEPVYVGE